MQKPQTHKNTLHLQDNNDSGAITSGISLPVQADDTKGVASVLLTSEQLASAQ